MARSNNAGLVVTLVIFVFLFVVAGVLAIIFANQIGDLRNQAETARTELNRLANPSERTQARVSELLANRADGTVVGQLLTANDALKIMITGSSELGVDAITKEKVDALEVEENNSLFREIRALKQNLNSEREFIQQLEGELANANERANRATQDKTTLERSFNEAVEALRSNLTGMQEGFTAYRSDVDGQRRELESTIGQVRENLTESITVKDSRIRQLEGETSELQNRIRDLESQLGVKLNRGVDIAQIPDGRVVSILSESNLVYLNRGREDNLMLGITFEVYDPRRGILQSEDGEWSGKATIEIVNVAPNFSVGRVIRTGEGQEILEGDLVANAVWDPQMSFRFYVFGEFDIDQTGLPTTADRRRIENMIIQWNGQVISPEAQRGAGRGLSYEVDFLVLGEEPEFPAPLASDVVDPRVIREHERQVALYESYQELISQAQALSIPILNQNRFLAMVGYHQR